MATHELNSSPETCHWGYFDSQLKPSLRIKSGDIATIHCVSGSAEILPGEPFNVLPEHREILGKLKPHLGRHILTGPVHVEGAERGDALAVEVLDIKFRTNWGWNVQRPLAGTLPEDFPFYPPDPHPDRFQPRRLHHAVGPGDRAEAVLRHHGRGAAAGMGPVQLDRAARLRRQHRQQALPGRHHGLPAGVRRRRPVLDRRRPWRAGRRRGQPDGAGDVASAAPSASPCART